MLAQSRTVGLDGNPVIDPVTKQFVRGDAVAQQIYIAVRTTLGTAGANTALGVQWPKKMGSRFEAELNNSISAALAYMTRSGLIRIEGIDITYPGTELFQVNIRYFDVNKNVSQMVTI